MIRSIMAARTSDMPDSRPRAHHRARSGPGAAWIWVSAPARSRVSTSRRWSSGRLMWRSSMKPLDPADRTFLLGWRTGHFHLAPIRAIRNLDTWANLMLTFPSVTISTDSSSTGGATFQCGCSYALRSLLSAPLQDVLLTAPRPRYRRFPRRITSVKLRRSRLTVTKTSCRPIPGRVSVPAVAGVAAGAAAADQRLGSV